MKLTKTKLKQIIKEEIEAVMTEQVGSVKDMNFLKKMLGFRSKDAMKVFGQIDGALEDLGNKFKKLQKKRGRTSQFEALLDELESLRMDANQAFGRNAKKLGDSRDQKLAKQKIKDITALVIQVQDHAEKTLSKQRADKIRGNELSRQYRREKEEKEFEKGRAERERNKAAERERKRRVNQAATGYARKSSLDWDEDMTRLEEDSKKTN